MIFCGNIIAEDCCIRRAIGMADRTDIVNIRDEKGRSTWPEKNSEEDIDRTLSKISIRAQQGEYFNNPYSEGTVFKEVRWGKPATLGIPVSGGLCRPRNLKQRQKRKLHESRCPAGTAQRRLLCAPLPGGQCQ